MPRKPAHDNEPPRPEKSGEMPDRKQPSREDDQPGLEALEPSTLEVAEPRRGLSYSRTWEKASTLPESTPSPYQSYPPSAIARPPQTAYTSIAPPSNYLRANGSTPSTATWADPLDRESLWGLKRQIFWAIIAVGAFTMVVAIALGVGLGVALHKNTSASTTAGGSLPPPNSATSIPLPAPTAQGTVSSDSKITCPANNLTLYAASAISKTYLLLCGRDYSGAGGAVDISNQEADTMAACIEACAEEKDCIAAGWGSYDNKRTCFLKSSVGEPNWSGSWTFAIEDNDGVYARALDFKKSSE